MARLNARSVKSRQNAILRYVVSTDVETAARDFNTTPNQIRSYLTASPKTLQNDRRYQKLLSADASTTAKKNDVRLVQRLSGKRLAAAYSRYDVDDRTARAIRYAQVTRIRRRIVENGKTKYVPLSTDKGTAARKQILANMSGESSKSIIDQYKKGVLTEDEAKDKLSKLWKNSGAKGSDEYFSKRT